MTTCPRGCNQRLIVQTDGVPGCISCGYEDYNALARMPETARGIAYGSIDHKGGSYGGNGGRRGPRMKGWYRGGTDWIRPA